jgi:hypothetical protein
MFNSTVKTSNQQLLFYSVQQFRHLELAQLVAYQSKQMLMSSSGMH